MSVAAEFRFCHTLRVRYSEVDPQSIVFNSRYLEYCDAALIEYFRAAGFPPRDMVALHGCNLVVVRAEVDFLAPAHFDDLLELHVRVADIGRTSLRAEVEARRAGVPGALARISLKYVNVDARTGKPLPVPDSIRAGVQALESGAAVP